MSSVASKLRLEAESVLACARVALAPQMFHKF